jgi:protein involved in polysaccharide export with SLBB domain
MSGGNNTLPPPPGVDVSAGNGTAPKTVPAGTGYAGIMASGSGLTTPEITMPSSMDMIDNTHKLATGDRFYYQVLEDRDPPHPMMVNEKGLVNVPYLGPRPVAGETLRVMAYALQKELESTLYFHATVLAMPDTADHSHNQIYVLGAVGHQGPVNVPPDDVLTVWSALWAAGGLAPQADPTRVSVMRPDSTGKSPSKMEVNVQNIIDKGTGDVVVQAGDIILVPPKGEASGYVTITGDVRGPGMIGLPAGSNTTVSWVVLQAGGFTEWADEEDVEVVHYDEQGKRHDHTVNIGAVLNKGEREKDATVQAGDMIIVPQDWIKM